MSRRRCRHRNTEVQWHQDRVRIPAPEEGPIYHYVELRRCVTCGELMGMGPSNDEWPEIRIEIRAAAIYAGGTTSGCTFDEAEGWYRYPDGNPVNDPQHQSLALVGWVASRHAGWLAHHIADHDQTDTQNVLSPSFLVRYSRQHSEDEPFPEPEVTITIPTASRRPLDRVPTCNEPSCCFTDRCQAPADCRGRQ